MKATAYQEKLYVTAKAAANGGLTRTGFREQEALFNTLYVAGEAWLSGCLLRSDKNRRRMAVLQMPAEEAACILATHLFWDRLDYVLEAAGKLDPASFCKLLSSMTTNRLTDMLRKRATEVPTAEYEEAMSAATDSFEADVLLREECLPVLRALAKHGNFAEKFSFIASKILGMKPGALAGMLKQGDDTLNSRELLAFCEAVFAEAAEAFSLPADFFPGATPLTQADIRTLLAECRRYESEAALAAHFSRCADRCRTRIRNVSRGRSC